MLNNLGNWRQRNGPIIWTSYYQRTSTKHVDFSWELLSVSSLICLCTSSEATLRFNFLITALTRVYRHISSLSLQPLLPFCFSSHSTFLILAACLELPLAWLANESRVINHRCVIHTPYTRCCFLQKKVETFKYLSTVIANLCKVDCLLIFIHLKHCFNNK